MKRNTSRLRAALITPVVAATALLLAAVPAGAHVSVSSTDASPGGFGKVTFRVPNESDTAATTKLVVTLPADAPFAFVTAGAKPGWTVETEVETLDEPVEVGDFTVSEAIRTITWTATGEGIGVGQFDEFALSGGPFPDADRITFTAEQTYADGEIADWAEVADEGEDEPQYPAPVLALAAAETADDVDTASADTGDASDTASRALAGVAVLVALGALLVAVRQNRHRA
ncbi:nuclear export factor GLE1 [Aeromicrobium marinum DSM 15272]|uniref:Nuclear export factor GLE1 n=1 Tax=Aeromicrobium marinum DSM 15272 TaxID=585531 RepID=E2S9Q0_9ACTN|nr:YcnI family protein [Aeromicrobium marinum]EFQ83974.1 nuclear export factor GLE1 [Aeromicrobium marinum DSM 15272]